MPKVTFVSDYRPRGQSEDIPTYKAGESYELEASYAEKYKRLGLAVDYVEKKAEPVAVDEPAVQAVDEDQPERSTTYHRRRHR